MKNSSCPALCRASTSLHQDKKDVDGRDKPGHDGGVAHQSSRFASPGMTRGKNQFIKICHEFETFNQPLRQKLGGLKPDFYGELRTLLFNKGEARLSMPISKYFTYAGSALLVLLFVSNAYLADDEADLRFDGSLYESALYAPRQEETRATAELRFTRDVTPAIRVREVFAVFVPNERRRGKRYS